MSRPKQWDFSPEFLTPWQCAKLLNVCEETIYRLLARREELQGIKLGSVWRIPVSQLTRLGESENHDPSRGE
jgi:excisionase family DNA binding protein